MEEDDNLEPGVKCERVIVEKSELLKLFQVCSHPNCGGLVDSDEIKVIEIGAAVKVKTTCLKNHVLEWSSSSAVGEGENKWYTINILLAAYTLFCGLNISQVKDSYIKI